MRKEIKKEIESLEILSMSTEGKGIGRHEGKVVFVDSAIPGDIVKVQVRKTQKKFDEAFITQLIRPSVFRKEPFCEHFGQCGGCKWQHISYEQQLAMKEETVLSAFRKIGKTDIENLGSIIGSPITQYYRNKLEFTFSSRKWISREEFEKLNEDSDRRGVGFHMPGFFDRIVDVKHCFLQEDPSNAIRNHVRKYTLSKGISYYDTKHQEGMMRNLVIKTSSLGQTLVMLSFHENDPDIILPLMENLLQAFPKITSLYWVHNPKKNDSIYDLDPVLFSGEPYIVEELGHLRYMIGPKSFFQTNPTQGKVLYDLTAEFAGLKKEETVYDLYTGVGSIALYLAAQCKTIIGIEEVKEAIDDAQKNAVLNQVKNAAFYTGDVRKMLNSTLYQNHGRPDVLITDPPRAGMHEDVIAEIIKLSPGRIVYVSCNPATQARDVELLSGKYNITRMRPVDMFPHTPHIENVALLELRK